MLKEASEIKWNSETPAYISGIDPEVIRRLYWEEELSAKGIAERLGVSVSSIRRIMHKYEIPRRSFTEAEALAKRLGRHKFLKGSQHSSWKGGRKKDPEGYIFVLIYPDNPYYSMADSNGYVREHRLVMAQHLGRPLKPWEIVHHRPPGIKDDNRIENLELFVSTAKHTKQYWEELRTRIADLETRNSNLESRVTQLEAENILLQKQLILDHR